MGKLGGRQRRENGYILIDVLVALVITSVSFVLIFGNISVAARHTARTRDKLNALIAARNETVQHRHVTFTSR
jgi:type II secretory pathway pseudopilin PulG